MEFLIKRTDGEWFSLHKDHFKGVLRPKTTRSEACEGEGDHRIKIPSGYVSFSFEDPGLHVVFEDYTGSREEANQIVQEVLQNIEAFSKERGTVIELG